MLRGWTWLRHHWEWFLAPAFAVAVVALLPHDCGGGSSEDVNTVRTPVVVATRQPFAPVRVLRLEIEGSQLVIGGRGVLLNGICNDSTEPVPVDLYFGLQEVGKDPISARQLDLVGTPRSPIRYTLMPGRATLNEPVVCQRTEPISGPVDDRLRPGRWQLVLNMTAYGPAGEQQIITTTSKPFDVVAGP